MGNYLPEDEIIMNSPDKDSELRKKLWELLEHTEECAVHDGYTHAAQTIFRVCAFDLREILENY